MASSSSTSKGIIRRASSIASRLFGVTSSERQYAIMVCR